MFPLRLNSFQGIAITLGIVACTTTQTGNPPSGGSAAASSSSTIVASQTQGLPPDADHALARLNSSSRHGEWVMISVPPSDSVRAWVVYPERKTKAPVVVVIHEIFGLSDWIRGVADQLAADGFIAIAPDLLSGHGANGGDSSSLSSQQEMTQATLTLAP